MTTVGKVSLRDTVLQRGRSRERGRLLVFNHTVLLLLTAFAVIPLLILSFNSVKTNFEIGQNPLGPPINIVAENYPNAWEKGQLRHHDGQQHDLCRGHNRG